MSLTDSRKILQGAGIKADRGPFQTIESRTGRHSDKERHTQMTTATVTTPLGVGTWAIDPAHSSIDFSVRHLMVSKVRGKFENFSGAIVVAEDGTPSVHAEIAVDSVNTGNDQRDAHIKSADFFGVETYPVATFTSSALESN